MQRAAWPPTWAVLMLLALSACGGTSGVNNGVASGSASSSGGGSGSSSGAAMAEPTQSVQAGAGLSGPPTAIVSGPVSVPCSTVAAPAGNPASGASQSLRCAP